MDRQTRSTVFLFVATLSGMSLWFMAAAIIPDMAAEAGLTDTKLAWLSSVVPAVFGIGALAFALLGLPDRIEPRYLFACCAFTIALLNLLLLASTRGAKPLFTSGGDHGSVETGVVHHIREPLAGKNGIGVLPLLCDAMRYPRLCASHRLRRVEW